MFRLALKGAGDASIPKAMMSKLDLFKRQPELVNGEKYTIKSNVNRNVLDLFMTRFFGAETTEKVTEENVEELRELCNELGFSGFDDEIRSVLGDGTVIVRRDMMGLRSRVDRHDVIIEELRARITELERQVQKQGQAPNAAKNLEETTQALRDDIRRDVSVRVDELAEEVQSLKSELKVSCADVKSLSKEVAALKDAERMSGGEVNVPDVRDFLVDEKDVELDNSRRLGLHARKGTYKRCSPPMTVAVTVYDEPDFPYERFTSIIEILMKMTHPGTLHLVGYNVTGPRKMILTPFMPNGTFEDVVKRQGVGRPEWNATKKSMCVFGIAAAMVYVHSQGILHRCLAAENIFLDEKMEPVIGGFSLSTLIGSDMTTAIGKTMYMAPELVDDEEYDGSIDVYAYAVLLFRFFGALDTLDDGKGQHTSHFQLGLRIVNGARLARPKNAIPDFYWNLIVRCWAQNPKERPTFCDIVTYLQKHRNDYAFPGANIDALREYEQRVLKGVALVDRTCSHSVTIT